MSSCRAGTRLDTQYDAPIAAPVRGVHPK